MSKYYEEFTGMKTCDGKMNRKISKVKIRGTKTVGMPMWMINNYIKSTCDNYTKLVYIMNIVDILSKKELDVADIGISTESVPVGEDGKDFENKLISHIKDSKREKYCLMSHISDEEKRGFLHFFSSCDRPICFAITKDNEIILLYDPRGNEGIKICDISYNSPIDMVLSGIGECLERLANAGVQVRNDQRLQDEHEARMVTQAMQTMGEAISVQDKLQNANLPGSHKAYLQSMYNGLIAKQEKLNEKIGICCPEIDARA